jgi:choice-of-anchor A domain-containing protein
MNNIYITRWFSPSRIPLLLVLVCLRSVLVLAQCDATNPLTVPNSFFNSGYSGNGNFNAIVFGNFATSDGKVGGRLAVGGHFENTNIQVGENFTVGKEPPFPTTSDNLIVNGTITNTNGGIISVRGNAKYGAVAGTEPHHEDGEGANSVATELLDFVDLKTHYTAISDGYSIQTPSDGGASASVDEFGVLTLTGTNVTKNYIFTIDLIAPEPTITAIKFVNIPEGSGILINILNDGVIQFDGSLADEEMQDAHVHNTLFNFPNVQEVFINDFFFQGSVLMPRVSEVEVTDGEITGTLIIGGSVTQATRFNILSSCLTYPLPVTLAKFSAQKEGHTAVLSWQTTSDVNAAKFIIERSQGKNQTWQAIGVQDVQESDAALKSYTFTDANPLSKTNLYRLKMVDKDGSFAYSRLVEVYFEISDRINTYPNPASDQITLLTHQNQKIQSVVAVSLTGREYSARLIGGTAVDVANWPAGIYLLKLTTEDGVTTTKKIIKN